MGKNAIELHAVTKVYGRGSGRVVALDSLQLEVPRGQMCAITGPSGSGKSTVMHVIAGLTKPTEGRVVVDGRDITNSPDDVVTVMRRQRVAMIFQTFNLQASWTAAQNIAFQLTLAGFPRSEHGDKVDAVLDRFGLADRKNHYPDELSRGEQQRVAIARALAVEPQILLADEPTGSLDSVASDQIVQILCDLSHEDKVTTVLVTHDPASAELADRQIRLRDGAIISDRLRDYEYDEMKTAEAVAAEAEVGLDDPTDAERKLPH